MRERLEEADKITSREVFGILVRALRYVAPFKFQMSVKLGLLVLGFLAAVLMPWPARILIDHVIQGIPIGEQATPFHPFVQPFVDFITGMPRTEMLIWTVLAQVTLLLFVGSFGVGGQEADRAYGGLPSGWDTATRTENEANSGFSNMGGLIGIFDFRWTIRLTQRFNHYYRTRLFERIQALPMTTFDDERIGDAVFRVMYDTPAITSTCYRIVLTPIAAPTNILLTMYMIGAVYGWDTPVIWAGFLGIVVALLPTLPLAGLQRRFAGRSRKTGATTTSSIEESMSNMVAVQSLGGEARERSRFDGDSTNSFRQFRYLMLAGWAAFLAAGFFAVLVLVWIYVWIGDAIIEGRLTVGDFAVLLAYIFTIGGSCIDLGGIWIRLQNEATGLNRVFFLMDAESETDRDGAAPLPPIRESVVVDHVDFAYENDELVLRDVSFEAPIGKITAFAGPAGAGKSTAVALIPRFIEPRAGQVRIDGTDIAGVTLESLRSQVAFVFQETVLFDATIEENIKLGNPGASETEVRRAARIAGADEFIQRLPEGYQARLGTSGGKLSVGQKQRLSIARALVRDAPILILDEPTSALDPDTERHLVAALREASRSRVVIVIAHRLSTIREADQILFIDAGKIVERGSHAELVARPDSAYRRYVELQTRGAA